MLEIPFTQETRLDLINLAIQKAEAKKYLEIGCDKNKIFNKIQCEYKVGVDPLRGGTHRMYSDSFFEQNTETFDVIFIDGLHQYDQVSRDFWNSLNCLNENGFIILHDMMPVSPEEAVVPIPEILPRTWVGDVWRLAFDLSNRSDITFNLVLIDNGCGIAWKEKQIPKNIETGSTWDFYQDNWKKLPLTTFNQITKKLS
jgi:predicted O-methyltransferase YrrM